MEKRKKFFSYTISDKLPEVGDLMVCVQRLNINYGVTFRCTSEMNARMSDTRNWKVVVE